VTLLHAGAGGCDFAGPALLSLVMWRALTIVLLTGLFVVVLPASAVGAPSGTRPPTQAERNALEAATYSSTVGDKGIVFVRVSVADPKYAIVGWRGAGDPSDWLVTSLFSRVGNGWRFLYWTHGHAPSHGRALADGACALAPSAIVSALFQYRCSFTIRQLHARPATHTERLSIGTRASAFVTAVGLGPAPLGRVCISRLSGNWAAAEAGIYVWLRKGRSGWRVAWSEGDDPKLLPPHPIVLSPASCVGYIASDYE
jgi:hypothetical protein